MELESLQIPESYKSTIEKFETDPEGAIASLKTRVEKRSAGAIGYFFLAWLYLKNDDIENAIEAAWQARVRAPGSHLINRLHYFIEHPQKFDAWEPLENPAIFQESSRHANEPHPIQDLDSLIDKLSSAETIRMKPPTPGTTEVDLSQHSGNVDDIVTETLAVIHEKQQNYDAAISTYKRLIASHPDKEEYYSQHLERLERKKENGEES